MLDKKPHFEVEKNAVSFKYFIGLYPHQCRTEIQFLETLASRGSCGFVGRVSLLGLSVCNGAVAGNDTKRPRNALYPKQYHGAGNHRSRPLYCLLFLRAERTFFRREKPMEHLPKSLPCPADVPCFVLSPYAELFLLFRNGFFHHYYAVFGRFGAVHHRWSVVHPSVFP